MSRTRERRSLWRLFRENTKTFLNVTFGMIPNVGRYAKVSLMDPRRHYQKIQWNRSNLFLTKPGKYMSLIYDGAAL